MVDGLGNASRNENGSGQQVNVGGDAHGPVVTGGGIHIGNGNSGIVITGFADGGGPEREFTIAKASRIPITSTWIGIVSGLVTIIGFVTGATSVSRLVGQFRDGLGAAPAMDPAVPVGVLAAALLVAIGIGGFLIVRFLGRHVLRLPKRWGRAWAGIRDESGRTFPYRLRLAAECDRCPGRRMRFVQIPETWVDHYQDGRRTKREVTKWLPVAVCSRNPEHRVVVDVSGNDFDSALPRG